MCGVPHCPIGPQAEQTHWSECYFRVSLSQSKRFRVESLQYQIVQVGVSLGGGGGGGLMIKARHPGWAGRFTKNGMD